MDTDKDNEAIVPTSSQCIEGASTVYNDNHINYEHNPSRQYLYFFRLVLHICSMIFYSLHRALVVRPQPLRIVVVICNHHDQVSRTIYLLFATQYHHLNDIYLLQVQVTVVKKFLMKMTIFFVFFSHEIDHRRQQLHSQIQGRWSERSEKIVLFGSSQNNQLKSSILLAALSKIREQHKSNLLIFHPLPSFSNLFFSTCPII
mmetsp:Transcript_14443/g.21813  ORF Transcript_14443/g.21813 Transcript_14443/m.21813 type:complete len:202 (-) Transcript_14443:553-1158(-)